MKKNSMQYKGMMAEMYFASNLNELEDLEKETKPSRLKVTKPRKSWQSNKDLDTGFEYTYKDYKKSFH